MEDEIKGLQEAIEVLKRLTPRNTSERLDIYTGIGSLTVIIDHMKNYNWIDLPNGTRLAYRQEDKDEIIKKLSEK